MLSLEEKRDLILSREKIFCQHIAAEIIERPKLAVWMILIPVFFIFYFWQLQRYSQGLREFTAEYLKTRQRALDYVYAVMADGGKINAHGHLQPTDVPPRAEGNYAEWIELLTDHYRVLMKAEGETYDDLVRSAYSSKKRFRDVLDSLSRAEYEFHLQLQPGLEVDQPAADDIINKIKIISARLRRDQLSEAFS